MKNGSKCLIPGICDEQIDIFWEISISLLALVIKENLSQKCRSECKTMSNRIFRKPVAAVETRVLRFPYQFLSAPADNTLL